MSAVSARALVDGALAGNRPSNADALAFATYDDLGRLLEAAGALRDRGHGDTISYSRKVFIPFARPLLLITFEGALSRISSRMSSLTIRSS